jgi:hypothetical protein
VANAVANSHSASYSHQHRICVIGSGPLSVSSHPAHVMGGCYTHLLMCQNVTADVSLFSLDELHVGLHSFLGEGSGEFVVDVRVGVESGKLGSTCGL